MKCHEKKLLKEIKQHFKHTTVQQHPPFHLPPQQQQHRSLTIGTHEFERVESFRYLGRIITDNNNDAKAIADRIRIATSTFINLRKRVLRSKATSQKTKLRMYDAVVGAQLLFGAETWIVPSASMVKLESFHQRNLRNITGMQPLFDKVKNHVVYPSAISVLRAAGRSNIETTIDDAALRFYGHILRRPRNDDLRFMLKARITDLRSRGSKNNRTSIDERMSELAQRAQLTEQDAATRTTWRKKRVLLREQQARIAQGLPNAQPPAAIGRGKIPRN